MCQKKPRLRYGQNVLSFINTHVFHLRLCDECNLLFPDKLNKIYSNVLKIDLNKRFSSSIIPVDDQFIDVFCCQAE